MTARPLAAFSDRAYISPDTELKLTMERINASEAERHLPRLLDRVAHRESLTISRHGKPVARPDPVPMTDLTAMIHEKRCY